MPNRTRTVRLSPVESTRVAAIVMGFFSTCLLTWTYLISLVLGLVGFEGAASLSDTLGYPVLLCVLGILILIKLHRGALQAEEA